MQYFTCQYVVSGTTIKNIVSFKSHWCDNCEYGNFISPEDQPLVIDTPLEVKCEIITWPKRCPECNATASKASRRRKLVKKMKNDDRLIQTFTDYKPILLTLTWPEPIPTEEVESIRKFMMHKFKLLRRKYKMPYGFYGFEFDTVYKKGKNKGKLKMIDGVLHCNPHIHCVYWGDPIPQAELSERATRYGFGKIVYIEYIRKNIAYAAKYVGKYIVKGKRTVQTFGKPYDCVEGNELIKILMYHIRKELV